MRALEEVEEHQRKVFLCGQGLCGALYKPVNERFHVLCGRLRLSILCIKRLGVLSLKTV